jgi:hypothetical protein
MSGWFLGCGPALALTHCEGANNAPDDLSNPADIVGAGIGESKEMPLIDIVIALIVVGVGLWLVNNFIPMAGSIKRILNAVVVIAVAIWVLQSVGLWERITSYRFTN